MTRYLTRRNGFWHYSRRVPKELASLDPREIVFQSTKVRIGDDRNGVRAARVIDQINQDVETYWRGLQGGAVADAQQQYADARRRARQFGFEYEAAADLAQGPTSAILARIQALIAGGLIDDPGAVAAALGGAQKPKILLSNLFEQFEALTRAERVGYSEDQVRKWANVRKRAIKTLIDVVGDNPVTDLSREDALDYQQWWQDRISDEDIEIATANKNMSRLARMLRTINDRLRLGMSGVFDGLHIGGASESTRAAFESTFVQRVILANGALGELNDEARAAVYLIAETGLRPSEAVNLTSNTIMLEATIPHLMIRPEGRVIKSPPSWRDMPLVGIAMQVLQAYPGGFPRYRHKADALSALVNKFFGNHGMRPTIKHTLYSLRHTFEDRLTAVEPPEKVQAALMGHKYSRPKYGAGPSLAQKRDWLTRIAFTPPAQI